MATAAVMAAMGAARGHGGDDDSDNESEVAALRAKAEEEERERLEELEARKKMHPIVRWAAQMLDYVNSTTVQTIMYIAFVFVFQMLSETLRNPKLEYYFDKQITDTFLENHFDSSHNTFESVRRTADIWEWGNTVLWPGFFANIGPCGSGVGNKGGVPAKGCNDDVWADGDGAFHMEGATGYTIPELVDNMDMLDWTDGIIIRQARALGIDPDKCRTKQLSGVCYPELQPYDTPTVFSTERMDMADFGYNWTNGGASPLLRPWTYLSEDYIGSQKTGVMSAAIPSMRMMPTGGFVAIVIPFFSTAWIPEEEGACDPAAGQVTWYKDTYVNTTSANKRAAFYCVRLSWNGMHCHQLCDPTSVGVEAQMATLKGRNTGVVRGAVEMFWNDMKRAHYIDQRTRALQMTLQLRSNHIGVRYRVTLLFEMTSLGAVLPSYDFETRVDDGSRYRTMKIFMHIAMGLCAFFVLLEGIAMVQDGVAEYFSDMWNIMDWLNFTIFFLVWNTLRTLIAQEAARDDDCSELCATTGYRDDWKAMGTSREVKIYMSLCVCIQMLKIIKFTNVLIPKMGLMTAVLSKGLADLAFFGIVFIISMLAFCMMFYVQLGSVMEDFNDQTASFVSLARALFGDFDIDDIMNNSSGYLNAVLFLVYLFVAVFILLSMFLAILGEAQAAVRSDQDDEKEAGTAPPDYGVLHEAGVLAKQLKAKVMAKMGRDGGGADGGAGGGGGADGGKGRGGGGGKGGGGDDDDEVLQLKHELENSLGGIRAEIGIVAQQVAKVQADDATRAAADGADGAGGGDGHGSSGFDDARALRKVVESLEQRMARKLTSIDERLARTTRSKQSGQKSKPPAAGDSEADGGDPAAASGGQTQSRRRRKPAEQATPPAATAVATTPVAPSTMDDPDLAC